ncbi:hypothetical protein PENTCL1PPCAC_20156 [Pristionchus entomophagus]|uniref:Uncharacterized protein n=1 Tax=Pristionchus entomophagus TaxID=358040 RepID=A0AAV5TUA0_9BILA|nr:hypothetical protein PENTCL1PPCAC_20156 [Pristionchus entomophagus]
MSNWRAPISFAIYLHELQDDPSTVRDLFLSAMANVSDPEATRHVNVHVLFNKFNVRFYALTIASLGHSVMMITFVESYFARYPINVVRNIARTYTQTQYQAMADIDFLFSAHFEDKMRLIADKVTT